jgi:hypothetical protein
MYRDGDGVDESAEAAARWFLAAARQGYDKAQNHIGVRMARGEGVPKDEVQALVWLTLSARAGNDLAEVNRRTLAARLSEAQRAEAERRADAFRPDGN